MRKIIVLTLTLVFLISTVCFAAVSSSGRSSSSGSKSFSAPSGSSSTKSAAPGNTGGTYKPSAPANSFGDKAPASQTTPGMQSQTQSSTGGFWRNASMIGGGFLAGSLLGNMFGFGNNMGGGMSGIFGMLINILIIGGIVMLVRNLWDKYKSNKDKDRYR